MLSDNAKSLARVYRHYASDSEPGQLTSWAFRRMVLDCSMISRTLPRLLIDAVYRQSTSGQQTQPAKPAKGREKAPPEGGSAAADDVAPGMYPAEFSEALVRLAGHKYSAVNPLSRRLSVFLERDLLPNSRGDASAARSADRTGLAAMMMDDNVRAPAPLASAPHSVLARRFGGSRAASSKIWFAFLSLFPRLLVALRARRTRASISLDSSSSAQRRVSLTASSRRNNCMEFTTSR
jgi:hypothetical protein